MWADLYTRGTALARQEKKHVFWHLRETCRDMGAEVSRTENGSLLFCRARTTHSTFGHHYLVVLKRRRSGTLVQVCYNLVGARGGPYKDFIVKFFCLFARRVGLESAILYDVVSLKRKFEALR